jgi:hypothetical protein
MSEWLMNDELKLQFLAKNGHPQKSSIFSLLSLLFDPEDGGDMFLRNVG